MAQAHILLLPRLEYFKWVRAAQKYALHFGTGITSDPTRAGNQDVVTVVVAPKAFQQEGNIVQWLKTRFPRLMIDAIHANTPEKLGEVLAGRIEKDSPFGSLVGAKTGGEVFPRFPKDRLYLFWPTDYPTILQPFGVNPELYLRYGLPGHGGLDIRAPHDAKVYACADGEVDLIEDGEKPTNYGRQVGIRHRNGYRTIYTNLEPVLVNVGDQVKARQPIGRLSSSGNHLHLTLKKDRATENGETDYPVDIIDPTPFLVFQHQEEEVMEVLGITRETSALAGFAWTRPCLVGVNARWGGTMQEVDFRVLREARVEAVKVSAHTPEQTIHRLHEMNPDMFILGSMVTNEDVEIADPQRWVEEMYAEFLRLYRKGVRYFQIHQNPNLHQFGWRKYWSSGQDFGKWWLTVTGLLKEEFPEAQLGFPGVMPGRQVPGQRLDADVFLEGADQAVGQADWLGVTCYWKNEAEMDSPDCGRFYEVMRERFPEKLLIITAFGNIHPHTNPVVKGREYVKFYQRLRDFPGIGAAFAQILSAAHGYESMVWRTEDGRPNLIVEQVGAREMGELEPVRVTTNPMFQK